MRRKAPSRRQELQLLFHMMLGMWRGALAGTVSHFAPRMSPQKLIGRASQKRAQQRKGASGAASAIRTAPLHSVTFSVPYWQPSVTQRPAELCTKAASLLASAALTARPATRSEFGDTTMGGKIEDAEEKRRVAAEGEGICIAESFRFITLPTAELTRACLQRCLRRSTWMRSGRMGISTRKATTLKTRRRRAPHCRRHSFHCITRRRGSLTMEGTDTHPTSWPGNRHCTLRSPLFPYKQLGEPLRHAAAEQSR